VCPGGVSAPLRVCRSSEPANGHYSTAHVATRPPPGRTLLPAHIFDLTFISAAPGTGAALSWIFFLIILALTLVLFASARFWVFYGSA
jgi:ABC-type sugar transport system permease subunit